MTINLDHVLLAFHDLEKTLREKLSSYPSYAQAGRASGLHRSQVRDFLNRSLKFSYEKMYRILKYMEDQNESM